MKIKYEKLAESGMVRIEYGGGVFTFSPYSGEKVSADNDGALVLDTRVFIDIDDKYLYIEDS